MLVTQGNVAAIFKGYTVKFWEAFAASPAPLSESLVMKTPSTGLLEQHNWLSATAGIRELVDEAQINGMRAQDYSILNKEYEETLELKQLEVQTDKFGLLAPRIQILGANGRYHPDQLMRQLIVNAFNGVGQDYTGTAFFGVDKQAYDGAAKFTNLGHTALTAANFRLARANLKARTNAAGRPLNLGIDLRLITSVKNEGLAREILVADRNAYGATNVDMGTAKLVTWPELDAAGLQDAWLLADFGNPLKPFIQQELIPWTYYTVDNPQAEYVLRYHKFLYQIYAAYALGYGFPEVIWGSPGS